MNMRIKIYLMAAALVAGLASCAIDAPVAAPEVESQPQFNATDVVPGRSEEHTSELQSH